MRDNRLVFIVTDKTGTQLIEVKAARNDARIPWDFLRDALALPTTDNRNRLRPFPVASAPQVCRIRRV